MYELFWDALIDSAKLIPFLLIIYIVIELIEYRFGNKIREGVLKAGAAGPAVGALVGSLPQCGFSVIATVLYTQRLATLGTLLAVYLSTSDEAIPIILSQPDKAGIIIPLIITKIIIALLAGYSIDLILRKKNKTTMAHIEAYEHGTDDAHHHHEEIVEKEACCNHKVSCSASKFKPKEIFLHPLIHTIKIFVYIFLVSLTINFIVFFVGQTALNDFFGKHIIWQPFLAGLIGLIPNCAASVAITEMYLQNTITFGAVISGLCASGGLGLLVLLKEEKNKKDVWKIIGTLLAISIAAGLIVQYIIKL